jgi:hypothetical protein
LEVIVPAIEETYLGDGLYASFDGYQICLRASQMSGDHLVYLDAPTLAAFEHFVIKLRDKRQCTG